ncbi:MAG: SDR family NAD(P)-dependent oxidoreductase [Chitinophagales bacterium]|nr:SDR family NAD(P)-dependent oxidoreductase [Chitinophagales bacterium]
MKKVIIVGASSGIGRQLALLYAQQGHKVGITGRRGNMLQEVQHQFPDLISIQRFDNTTEDISFHLNQLINRVGGMDLFILSSGTGNINLSLDWNLEKEMIDLNVVAWTEIVDFIFHFFQKQRKGHLTAITSIGSIRGEGRAPAYNATKAFQANYLEGLRKKSVYEMLNISVTDIQPGFVKSAMAKSYKRFWEAPLKKAAQQIFYAIERKKKKAYVTKRWWFIAQLLKILPDWIYYKI